MWGARGSVGAAKTGAATGAEAGISGVTNTGWGAVAGAVTTGAAGTGVAGAVVVDVGAVAQPNTLTYSAAINKPRDHFFKEATVCISRPIKNSSAHYM